MLSELNFFSRLSKFFNDDKISIIIFYDENLTMKNFDNVSMVFSKIME